MNVSGLVEMKNPELVYNVVLLGMPGVGKSSIAMQFQTGYFVSEYDPTMGTALLGFLPHFTLLFQRM
jgi:GTPase SAR1 family protein